MKGITLVLFLALMGSQCAWAARAKVDALARDPYVSALVIDADSGKILIDDNSGAKVYPASVLKLMDLLVILEHVEQGKIQLDNMVQVTEKAAKMGGSQVYLDPKEQFSVEDLLYALAVQSANDAAVALAIHVAGSVEAFVAMMNQKAAELEMKDTVFHSVHGLPPAEGQKPDETTAYDLSLLGRELTKHPEIFRYTSIQQHDFREGKFIMRNHNHLLGKVIGCDGFKTGYFKAAGFSIVATATQNGARVIAIVMGSRDRKVRDSKTMELLAKGFSLVEKKVKPKAALPSQKVEPAKIEVQPPAEKKLSPTPPPIVKNEPVEPAGADWSMFFIGLVVGVLFSGLVVLYRAKKRSKKRSNYRDYG